LAGRTGDGVRSAAQWDPDYAVRIRSWVEEGARVADRDPAAVDFIVENWTCLHPDRDVARREARRRMATFLPHLGPMLDFYKVPPEEVRAAVAASTYGDEAALEVISDTTIDRFMAAGDHSDLRRGLDRLEDAGLDAVSFSGSLGPDTAQALQILGAELGRRLPRGGPA
jgi:alkanesulfonate monooxygenase SsuD/methylene tetrahydromethanopterin reductase-like flavin-dependent oxidoreductase (luciferase family)